MLVRRYRRRIEPGVKIITTGGAIASLPHENGNVTAALQGQAFARRLGVDCTVDIQAAVTIGSFAFDYVTLQRVASDVLQSLESPLVRVLPLITNKQRILTACLLQPCESCP